MTEFPEQTLLDWVSALGGRTATPAGGALSLVTLAGAAALAGKIQRLAGRDSSAYEGLARLFLLAAWEDGELYAAVRREGGGGLRCLDAGLRHLETAVEFLEALGDAFDGVRQPLAADLAASGRLARASAQTLLVNLAVNKTQWGPELSPDARDRVTAALEDLTRRMEAA